MFVWCDFDFFYSSGYIVQCVKQDLSWCNMYLHVQRKFLFFFNMCLYLQPKFLYFLTMYLYLQLKFLYATNIRLASVIIGCFRNETEPIAHTATVWPLWCLSIIIEPHGMWYIWTTLYWIYSMYIYKLYVSALHLKKGKSFFE